MVRAVVGFPVSGFLPSAPISKAEAEAILGSKLSDASWAAVNKCFRDHGERLNSLDALPADNDNRNDPDSYRKGRAKAEKNITKALMLIQVVAENRQLCRSASQTYSMRGEGKPDSHAITEALQTATMALINAQMRFRYAADPVCIRAASTAKSAKELARSIVTVLREAKVDTRMTGWDEATLEHKMSEAKMTPVEQLLSAMNVHTEGVAETPSAYVRWLRGALGEMK